MRADPSSVFDHLAQAFKQDEQPQIQQAADIELQRDALIKRWRIHPWWFLSALDTTNRSPQWPDGRPVVWTKDEKDRANPIKPFPGIESKPYLPLYLDILLHEQMVLVDKPRQVMATWTTVLFLLWDVLFFPARRWLLVKSTEEEAIEILQDKPMFSYWQLPEWFRNRVPINDRLKTKLVVERHSLLPGENDGESYILPIASNAADRELRGGTGSGALVDEAARQAQLKQMFEAAYPMSAKLFGLTTPAVGNPGAKHFKELIDEGREV